MLQSDGVWVEMEVLKGTLISVYRGRLSAAVFERFVAGELKGGIIALEDTYWSYEDGEGNEGWVVVGATPGPYSFATGTIYVRADTILVLLPLRDGSERETHRVRPILGTRDDS